MTESSTPTYPINPEIGHNGEPLFRTIEDFCVGLSLPTLEKKPTTAMLFRFSAVTWNTHRIHYDQTYAQYEGHPNILVQATMHGAFMLEMLNRVVRYCGLVKSFEYMNRGRAVPGDTLICQAVVTDIDSQTFEVHCDVSERNQHGDVCAKGKATLLLRP
jgi:hydroxyacyl-ACP dehydratase HTD2-like protein with hotdog domain